MPNDSKRKGASFDFKIKEDTASGVANEMVNDLSVDPSFTNQIERQIEASVHQFKEKEKHLKH